MRCYRRTPSKLRSEDAASDLDHRSHRKTHFPQTAKFARSSRRDSLLGRFFSSSFFSAFFVLNPEVHQNTLLKVPMQDRVSSHCLHAPNSLRRSGHICPALLQGPMMLLFRFQLSRNRLYGTDVLGESSLEQHYSARGLRGIRGKSIGVRLL